MGRDPQSWLILKWFWMGAEREDWTVRLLSLCLGADLPLFRQLHRVRLCLSSASSSVSSQQVTLGKH